jgi:hypothetical protein
VRKAYQVATAGTTTSASDATSAAWDFTSSSVGRKVNYQGRIFSCITSFTYSGTQSPPTSNTNNTWWQHIGYAAGPIDTSGTITDGTVVWTYLGSIVDTAGAAVRHRLKIVHDASTLIATGFYKYDFTITIQPLDAVGNLDALAYLRIKVCGLGATSPWGTFYAPVPHGRLYANSTDSNAANGVSISWSVIVPTGQSFGTTFFSQGLRVTLFNVYGPSDEIDYGPVTAVGQEMPPGRTILTTAGGSGGGSGGGDEGTGYCVAGETVIELDSGKRLTAEEIYARREAGQLDHVWTLPEDCGPWGAFAIDAIVRVWADERRRVRMEDGRSVVVTPDHRFMDDMTNWVHAKNLSPGDVIFGRDPGFVEAVEDAGAGYVYRFTIRKAHTYLTEGLLSHNAKKIQ